MVYYCFTHINLIRSDVSQLIAGIAAVSALHQDGLGWARESASDARGKRVVDMLIPKLHCAFLTPLQQRPSFHFPELLEGPEGKFTAIFFHIWGVETMVSLYTKPVSQSEHRCAGCNLATFAGPCCSSSDEDGDCDPAMEKWHFGPSNTQQELHHLRPWRLHSLEPSEHLKCQSCYACLMRYDMTETELSCMIGNRGTISRL